MLHTLDRQKNMALAAMAFELSEAINPILEKYTAAIEPVVHTNTPLTALVGH